MVAIMNPLLNPLAQDQRTVAERQWRAPVKPRAAQLPCDHGMFSDEMDQIEMFMEPCDD